MRNKNRYQPGNHYVICDYSGFKVRAQDTMMTWDGYRVHKRFWEPRHPQDFVKSRADKQHVTNSRPESANSFLTTNEVTADDL